MFDGNTIAALGTVAGSGAVACGLKALRAHFDLAWHQGPGAAMRRIYDDTLAEPVPDEMVATLARLSEAGEP